MRILTLVGGPSAEREVSLQSGQAVTKALESSGHTVQTVDLISTDLPAIDYAQFDVIFPVLHGAFGEDGQIQSQLEAVGIPYIGSGPESSALCFDKSAFRDIMAKNNIKTPGGSVVDDATFWGKRYHESPFILKPVSGGSSIDMYFAPTVEAIDEAAVKKLFLKYTELLYEEYIMGGEITVGVLGDTSLPVVEIIPPDNEAFDYANKYNGKTVELCPPQHLSAEVQAQAQALALTIHSIANCRHMSRTDMFVTADQELIVIETNTLPGMTEQSLFPKAARAAGYQMPDLMNRLLSLATS